MTPSLSPSYDNKIARKYSAKTLDHKVDNKTALQKELGWIQEPKRPVLCIVTGMTDTLGGALMEEVLPGIEDMDAELLVRGRGSETYGKLFTQLAKKHPDRVAILPDDEESVRKMLAASDVALFFAPQKDTEDLENALRYGAVPVAMPQNLLENYNPVQESGNAFLFEKATHWKCFASLVRALETFKFPFDWRTIQRHAMESVPQK